MAVKSCRYPRWKEVVQRCQRGLINEFSLLGTFESLIKLMTSLSQSTWVVLLSLLFSFSHKHSHKHTHVPKSVFPRQYLHRTLQATLYFRLLSSWADAESTVYYSELSPFLSWGHSDDKEKTVLLSTYIVPNGAPLGPVLTFFFFFFPQLYRRIEANLTQADVFSEGQMFFCCCLFVLLLLLFYFLFFFNFYFFFILLYNTVKSTTPHKRNPNSP